jgi:hypothetical protein
MVRIDPTHYDNYNEYQLGGSEYGGVGPTHNTVQPKGAEALSAGDRLRLGYLVGDLTDPLNQQPELSLEDRRQMLGLKPAGASRPVWLAGTGRVPEAEILGIEYPDEIAELDPDESGGIG